MTKTLILTALAGMALASCSSDEPVYVNEGRDISFRPAMSVASRATETTNANLSGIKVSAFLGDGLYFNNIDFNKGSDGFYVSTPAYHWPGDDTPLTFYSYSPASPGGTVSIGSEAKTLTDFSPATDLSSQVDFVTAKATGTKSQNESSGVELDFNHQLSQIEVRAKADNEIYTFKISGVRIGQPVSKGSFDFESSDWTLGTDKAIYEDTYATAKTVTDSAASVMGAGGNAMLIPQQLIAWNPETDSTNTAEGAYISIKLQVTTTETGVQMYPFPSDGNCQWAAIPIDTKWEAGKKYIYTLDLSEGAGYVDPKDPKPGDPVLGGPIKFTVDVKDWVTSNQDLPMTTD